jgi:mannose-6-phosphate isomerase-like protein (cupin superfamily)
MTFLFVLTLLGYSAGADAQTTKPRAAAPTATAAMSITVTDGRGAPVTGVAVRASGPVDREGTTESNGSLRFEGLRSGTYRLRFTCEGFVTLERDVAIPAGQRALDQHVILSAAEKPPAPPPPAPAPAAPAKPELPPPGKAVTVSVPDFIERNFIAGTQPQKASPIACSGLVQTLLWQIREPWDNRQHATADAMLYVVGGEGTLKMGSSDVPLHAGTFVSVPRGTSYGFTRRGRNPLIVLGTLAGDSCSP